MEVEKQAQMIRKAIAKRLLDCGLELHPKKTRIVYCKDELRKGRYTDEKFDFLGDEFRPRKSINRHGKVFANFSPPGLDQSGHVDAGNHPELGLRQCSHQSLEELSRLYNPIIRGWFQYYGRYYRTALYSVIRQLDQELVKWARQKYKKLRIVSNVQGSGWRQSPVVLRTCSPLDQNAWRLLDGSRMTRECHVRFCERLG